MKQKKNANVLNFKN